MNNLNKRLAIIPARIGSKRIPQKNIRDFFGKPMIYYALETVIKSKLFDKIHVSTDSDLIIDLVNEFGLLVDFKRPEELSDDITPLMPVLKFVVQEYLKIGETFNEVWMIMPCSPLINENDLLRASNMFNELDPKQTIIPVVEYSAPIQWAFSIDSQLNLIPQNKGDFKVRSQDLKKYYYDTGTFVIYPINNIINSKYEGTDNELKAFLLPRNKSIDIDTEDDWLMCEILYKMNNI